VFYTSEQFPIIGQNLDPKKSDQVSENFYEPISFMF